jgi:hypothetical protein
VFDRLLKTRFARHNPTSSRLPACFSCEHLTRDRAAVN